jgi:adenylate kinase family enzyme
VTPGRLLVITGPPAAGKTTAARALACEHSPGVHLHADDFWAFIVAGYIEPWLPASHAQNEAVIRAVCDTARQFADGGFHVVLDGVVGPWFLDELVARCDPRQMHVDYAILLPSLPVLLERLAGRTGHGFTSEAAAQQMHAEFVEAGQAHDRHVIDTTGLTTEDVLTALRTARHDGRLRLNTAE